MQKYKFSTNFEKLARRLADSLKARDEEMILETYEALARYHFNRKLPQSRWRPFGPCMILCSPVHAR
ncbi:MAG: hypothetical protein U5N86_10640 [Planctomycetota bacterium]|nr:hypothetical protein [Planctomycetota bacterium]